ncbi:MAG TPA: hypothetical protein VJN50_03340 [Actinomycetota bacterium]|nr:hypothetical protein [Actinomycetota bacterium]
MRWGRLVVENHRGRPVPRVLGITLAALGLLGTVGLGVDLGASSFQSGAAAGCLMVFAAGLVDDLHPIGPRGLRGHLRALADGRMTTGILKLVVAVASAAVVVALLGRGTGLERLGSVVLVAGAANVWNGLDVRPGRALKAFLAVVTLPLFLDFGVTAFFVWALWPAAVLALVPDLREKAMLGDSGSNLIGFAVGVQLAASLPTWAQWLAAGVLVALNLLAETVTLSRMIEAVPPIRWFDRLGRVPD